jgi:hypothetical protein
MATKPPKTQASSKTVASIEISWDSVIDSLDPEFEREKHDELFYDFGEAGHRARNFYGDPYTSGAYAPQPAPPPPPPTPPQWWFQGAVVDLDFENDRYFGGALTDLTIVRASPGYAQNKAGQFVLFGNNVLGRSDELFENYGDGGEEDEASIIGQELVIAGGDAAELLQLVEEPLDEIAFFVKRLVVGERRAAIGFGRDDRLGLTRKDSLAQVIRVITLVGDDGFSLETFDEVMRLCDVVALPWPEKKPDGIAERVGGGVDLRAQSAPRSAQTLGIRPPLAIRAPAACW